MDSLGSIAGVREVNQYGHNVGAPFDGNAQNDTAFAMVSLEKDVTVYDLGLTKNVKPSTVIPGEIFTYSLQVQNNGPDAANNIRLTDMLPDSIQPITFIAESPVDPTSRILEWVITSLDSGATKNIEFTASFSGSLGSTESARDLANTSFVGAPFDVNTQNDTANALVTIEKDVRVYDLELTKSVNPGTVIPGEIFTYSLQIHNGGPDAANNIRLSDMLPDSIHPVNFTTESPVDPTARILEWTIASLDSGATKDIEFTASFLGSLGSTEGARDLANTGFVGAPLDVNTQNDTAQSHVVRRAPGDRQIMIWH